MTSTKASKRRSARRPAPVQQTLSSALVVRDWTSIVGFELTDTLVQFLRHCVELDHIVRTDETVPVVLSSGTANMRVYNTRISVDTHCFQAISRCKILRGHPLGEDEYVGFRTHLNLGSTRLRPARLSYVLSVNGCYFTVASRTGLPWYNLKVGSTEMLTAIPPSEQLMLDYRSPAVDT